MTGWDAIPDQVSGSVKRTRTCERMGGGEPLTASIGSLFFVLWQGRTALTLHVRLIRKETSR